jgi:competence protein ComEA
MHFSREQCRIMLCMVCAVLALFLYRYDLPAGSASSVSPASETGEQRPPFVIEVAGEVARPGVYSFAHGASCAEAIEKAGGLKNGACVPEDVLCALPVNGSRLSIGTGPGSTAVVMMDPHKRFLYCVPFSINLAGAEELVLVPGIGEKTAQAIVSYRERHGPFPRLQSLLEVPGIGRHTFERMKDFLVL